MEDEKEEMLNEEENLVVEDTTENVGEQATEEVVEGEENTTETDNSESIVTEEEKKYTEKEFNDRLNDLLSKKIARKEAKIRREYEKKYAPYSELGNVVGAGLGTNDMKEVTKQLRSFYEGQGVQIPVQRSFSNREEQILAKAEADDIISAGYEDIVEEVNRLTDVGFENMSGREKLVFKILAEERQKIEAEQELLKIGADKKILDDEKYKNFIKENKLENVPVKNAYELYQKLQPKPQVEQIGDLTNNNPKQEKDFISEAEYDKMTEKEIEQNMKLIRKSMPKW